MNYQERVSATVAGAAEEYEQATASGDPEAIADAAKNVALAAKALKGYTTMTKALAELGG